MSKEQIAKKIMNIENQLVLEQRNLAELQLYKHQDKSRLITAQQKVNRLIFEEHQLQTELRKLNIKN